MAPENTCWMGKICLITGGSSGIGLAAARLLAGLGAWVWLVARDRERLDAALRDVEAMRRSPAQRCGAVAADVSDEEQVMEAVAHVTKMAGVPNVLINSAGAAHPGYVQDLSSDVFRWMMNVNYFGTVYSTKAVLPGMLARGSGHIINISSGAGFVGVFGYAAYGPSKFAVAGFTGVLRSELKRHGIRVSLVFPPDTETPQLVYENRFKPPETRTLAGKVRSLSAEAVARVMIAEAARGRYLILPGPDIKLLYWLTRLLGGSLYSLMDRLIARTVQNASRS